MKSLTKIATTLGLAVFSLSIPSANSFAASSPLQSTLRAHGGIERWQEMGTFSYRLNGFPLSVQSAKPNVSTVDLKNRFNRIDGEGFSVGFDGTEAWGYPKSDSAGLPPRFFTLGSFYFIGMPFVFADPGVQVKEVDSKTVDGKEYRVLEASFVDGVGYTEKDTYELYINKKTNRLYLINHSVTEDGMALERVTWVFNEWQEVSGLLVPKEMTFFKGWTPSSLPTDGAKFSIEQPTFRTKAPQRSLFIRPSGAIVAQTLH